MSFRSVTLFISESVSKLGRNSWCSLGVKHPRPTFIDQMSAEIITIIYQLCACVTFWNRVNKLSKGVANKNFKMQMGGACVLLEFSGAACR